MFGIPSSNLDRGIDQGLGYAYDLVLMNTDVDDHDLPVTPNQSSAQWPRVAADLLAAAWFSHLQQVAELLESTMLNLDRGRLVVAAVQSRTALEVSERAFAFIGQIATATDDNTLSTLIQTFLTGDRTPSDGIGSGIRAMRKFIAQAHHWSEDSLPGNLYSQLCNLTHPHSKLKDLYTSEHEKRIKMNPPREPLWTDKDWVDAGREILVGAVIAGEALRLRWQSVADVQSALRSRDSMPSDDNTQLRTKFAIDPLSHFEAQNVQTYLPTSTMMAFRRPGQDFLGPGENRLAASLEDFECSHLPLGYFEKSGKSAFRGWIWLRVRILLELELSIAEHLNRGEVVSSAALSRFALEHAASLFHATRVASGSKLDAIRTLKAGSPASADEVLKQAGVSSLPDFGTPRARDSSGEQIAKNGLNAFAHPDMAARKIYWQRFTYKDRVVLLIPGQAKHLSTYSSTNSYDVDNPWSVSVAMIDVIELQGIVALANANTRPML